MEVSFKFNNGETGGEMVAAILALFGATATAPVNVRNDMSGEQLRGAYQAPLPGAGAPAGQDDDSGPANNATHDADGTPWDARIHSDKRTVTDKGIWRRRKSVAPTTFTAVMNELRAAGKILAPQGTTPTVGVATPATPGQPPAAPQPGALAPLPGMPAMPPLAPLAPVETPYQKFVDFLAHHMNTPANPAGRFTTDWIAGAIKQYGYVGADGNGHVQLLEHVEGDKVTAIHQAFAAAIGATI